MEDLVITTITGQKAALEASAVAAFQAGFGAPCPFPLATVTTKPAESNACFSPWPRTLAGNRVARSQRPLDAHFQFAEFLAICYIERVLGRMSLPSFDTICRCSGRPEAASKLTLLLRRKVAKDPTDPGGFPQETEVPHCSD